MSGTRSDPRRVIPTMDILDNTPPDHVARLVAGRVAVRRDPPKNKIGLIYVPDGEESWPTTGTIVMMGAARAAGEDTDLLRAEGLGAGSRVIFKARPHGGGRGALVPDEREGAVDAYPANWDRVVVLEADDILCEIAVGA